MGCAERWRELVRLLDDCWLHYSLRRGLVTAQTYNRVRRAVEHGSARSFVIAVRCANMGEISCGVYAHETVQEMMKHELSKLAFGSLGELMVKTCMLYIRLHAWSPQHTKHKCKE